MRDARRASATITSALCLSAAGRARSATMSWPKAEMLASGLFSSCATPLTNCPMAAIFSDWMSCCWSCFSPVASRMTQSTSWLRWGQE